MNKTLLDYIIIINGAYDILCALCILQIIDISILNNLHISMYINKLNDQEKRFLSYWIFTYGSVRLFNGFNLNNELSNYLVTSTYIFESIIVLVESKIYNKIHKLDALFPSGTSMILAILIILRK